MKKPVKSAYAAAGVNIDEKMRSLAAIKRMVHSTTVKGNRSSFGAFGCLFPSPGADHLLVASTDGVGTKLKVAVMAGRHDTVGQDIVNHCVNDILVQGAIPLFFLDYLGVSRLSSGQFKDVLAGICKACRENHCQLVGGETAELPGLYPPGEYDLVGTIVGTVPRRRLVTGDGIRAGDTLIGLPSSGLHTNGYSLARKIIFEQEGLAVSDTFPGTRRTVSDVLLAVHRSYLKPVKALMSTGISIRGMAHITGGGFVDNIPRVLPDNVDAVIDESTWKLPPLFAYLQQRGDIDHDEMNRVFNMGIGYIVVVRHADAAQAVRVLSANGTAPRIIGNIAKGRRIVRFTGKP